ncbi:uncharacterized protein MELLADRAFT_84822 [Melampsora larici-populina 98AG31]|uniref:Uncharacterized protein n=1 Tax=Melampsora larici-populina (strain 98AG31 / pathotype 3-4-7) TaxID=747676 RepID=F4SCK7_MELLP|nr:uncharacterized protein MELLADRAFT_84822 [Melampsora larici-populina 98AG31]EGF97623.1 hypothetical protein MELLADRAFT_84822 [Melampsora larici-populina 98AG31]
MQGFSNGDLDSGWLSDTIKSRSLEIEIKSIDRTLEMPVQSTLRSTSGYETDDSAPRRSGRVTTPARQASGMICPPSDSRQSLPSSSFTFSIRPRNSSTTKQVTNRKRVRSQSESETLPDIETENESDVPEIISTNIRKIAPARGRQSQSGTRSSQAKSKSSKSKSSAQTGRSKEAQAESWLLLLGQILTLIKTLMKTTSVYASGIAGPRPLVKVKQM